MSFLTNIPSQASDSELLAWLERAEKFAAYLLESRERRWRKWNPQIKPGRAIYQKKGGALTFLPGANRERVGETWVVENGGWFDRDDHYQIHTTRVFSFTDGRELSDTESRALSEQWDREYDKYSRVHQRGVVSLYPRGGSRDYGTRPTRGRVASQLEDARWEVERIISQRARAAEEAKKAAQLERCEQKSRKLFELISQEYTQHVHYRTYWDGRKVKQLDVKFRTFASLCVLKIPGAAAYSLGFQLAGFPRAYSYRRGWGLVYPSSVGEPLSDEAAVHAMWTYWFSDGSPEEQQAREAEYQQLRGIVEQIFS